MAQLSLYMDEAEMLSLRKDAKANKESISAYARDIIARRHESERFGWENGWPPGFFDLYGSAPDFPDVADDAPDPVAGW